MKKTFCMFAALLLLSGCVKEDAMEIPGTNEEEMCEVSIKMGGEILNVTEDPLTKVAGKDLYGFEIYSKQSGEYSLFASGLFDDAEDLKVNLIKGKTFKIISTMIKDGKDVLFYQGEYDKPFDMRLENSFMNTYGGRYEDSQFRVGLTGLKSTSGSTMAYFSDMPKAYRYYGESEDVVCDEDTKFSINMKKVIFGIKYVVEGLEEGSVILNIQNEWKQLNSETIKADGDKELECIHTFEDFRSMQKIEEGVEYDIEVIHQHENGLNETIAKEKVKFKRNKRTTVIVKIKNDSGQPTKGNSVVVKLEESEMTDGDAITIS